MLNQKGVSPLIVIFMILVIGGLIGAAYYLGTQKNIVTFTSQLSSQNKAISPDVTPGNTSKDERFDLNGFPIFPNANFAETKDYFPCEEGKYSGFSICNAKAYIWNVNASFDEIIGFYKEDKSNSGWICSGGAGSYEDANNASGTTICKKGELNYSLFIDTSNGNSKITLSIPNGTPTGK